MPKKVTAPPAKKTTPKPSRSEPQPETKERNLARVPASPATDVAMPDDIDITKDARAGMENISQRDLAIPRMKLLQGLSPEVKKGDSNVEGCEVGDFYDSVNGLIYSGAEGFEAILIGFRSHWLEFIPRKKGSGFVADHGANPISLIQSCTQDNGTFILPSGNELVLTAEYLAMIIDPKEGSTVLTLLNFANSQFKHSRRLNTLITTLKVTDGRGGTVTPAIFYRTYLFKSKVEENKKGQTWMGHDIEPGRPVLTLPTPLDGRSIYLACRELRESFDSGKVKVQAPSAPGGESSGKEGDDGQPM